MFRCPKCNITFFTLRDLLTHFVLSPECRTGALLEALKRNAGFDTVVMILDTSYGKVE
jgi:hypothetical protein